MNKLVHSSAAAAALIINLDASMAIADTIKSAQPRMAAEGTILMSHGVGLPAPDLGSKSILDFIPDQGVRFSIMSGTYRRDTTAWVNAALAWCGSAPSEDQPRVLAGPSAVFYGNGFRIAGGNCRLHLEGVTFKNLPSSQTDVLGIFAGNTDVYGLVADGSHVSSGDAIQVAADGVRLHGVQGIHADRYGILFYHANYGLIENSVAYDNKQFAGIGFSYSNFSEQRGNRAWNNGAEGFSVDNTSSYNRIIGNLAYDNGVTGCFGGFGSGASANYNTFVGNQSYNNTCAGYGVQGRNVTLVGNVSAGNRSGVHGTTPTGLLLSRFTDAKNPASNLGNDVIAGNSFDETVGVAIEAGVPNVDVGSDNVMPGGVLDLNHAQLVAAPQGGPLTAQQCRFAEVTGNADLGLSIGHMNAGQACKVYNNSAVTQTFRADAIFTGPAGTFDSGFSLPAGQVATFIADSFTYVATIQDPTAAKFIKAASSISASSGFYELDASSPPSTYTTAVPTAVGCPSSKIEVFNGSGVPQTLVTRGSLFIGPDGNDAAALTVSPNAYATLRSNGRNWVVVIAGNPAPQFVGTTKQSIRTRAGLVEITGSEDIQPTIPSALLSSGARVRVWNNASVAHRLTSGGGNFVGPQGSGNTKLLLAANAIATLESDGVSWIAAVQR